MDIKKKSTIHIEMPIEEAESLIRVLRVAEKEFVTESPTQKQLLEFINELKKATA